MALPTPGGSEQQGVVTLSDPADHGQVMAVWNLRLGQAWNGG